MSEHIVLSPVEQALVSEISAWTEQVIAEVNANAGRRLSVILQEHGLAGKVCNFKRINNAWVLVPPQETAQNAPQEG